jgi:hypothetical protein
MGKYFADRVCARAGFVVMALSVGCSGTGGERPPESGIVSGSGTSSSSPTTFASSSTSSTGTRANGSTSTASTDPDDAGLGSDSYFGITDAPYNAVCLLDTVAFDMSYFAPDLDTVSSDFADAWDSEVGDPVPDPHTPIGAIDFFGLAAGPTAMSIGAVTTNSNSNFTFDSAPSTVLTNTPVTWSSAQPQHIVLNPTTTPFALLVGQPGNVRQITVSGSSGEFDVDTTCTKLTGDILLTIPSSAAPVQFGTSTIGALLGAPTYISTPGAGQPDSWQVRISTPRGAAVPIPNFGN